MSTVEVEQNKNNGIFGLLTSINPFLIFKSNGGGGGGGLKGACRRIRACAAPCRSCSFGTTLPSRSLCTASSDSENITVKGDVDIVSQEFGKSISVAERVTSWASRQYNKDGRLYAICTATNQYRKFETNILRKGIAQPQPHFPSSCVCERFFYFHTIDLPTLLQ